MIPLSLTLKGFLSFREEQRLDFARDQVWLLSGPNGSGKSTVFDAILFALYAGHRAGRADLHELINKGADRAVVRFDFLLDGRRYRAERSAERTTDRKSGRAGYAGAQQLYVWQDAGEGTWQAIPGTHRQGDFGEWVREHVGLSFDAFTSSALLMQGRADVLVAQDAEAARRRFEVLARIVGLDYYERLHKQADELRKRNEKRAGELQAQLEVVAPVEPAVLEELACRADAIAAQLADAEKEVEHLQQQKAAAARWAVLRSQRQEKQREWDKDARLLGDAVTIERDGARWQELQALLPALETLVRLRRQVVEAEAAAAQLDAERTALQGRAGAADAALARLRHAMEEAAAAQAADERRRQELVARQQQLTLALGPLRRLHRHRGQLAAAGETVARLAEQLRSAKALVREQEQSREPLAAALAAAAQAHRDAANEATMAKTRLLDFEEQARRFEEVADAQLCSYCGQRLSPEHARREKARISRELAARRAMHDTARRAAATAAEDEARCQDALQSADQALAAARTRADGLRHEARHAETQLAAHRQAALDAYQELPEPYRSQVSPQPPADWAATTFPAAADLTALDAELARLGGELRELHQAAAARDKQVGRLRQEQQAADANREALRAERLRVENAIAQQAERVRLGRQHLEPARAALPARWQLRADALDEAEVGKLAEERRRLARQDAAGRLERLRHAQAAREPLRRQLERIDQELAELPEEVRRDPATFEPALRAAKARDHELRNEHSTVQAERRQLVQQQQRREQLAADFRAEDRRRHLSARLADLLSRRHLQRHLLRQAEVGIVESTNRVLDRITAGELCVRLLPEEDNDENRALQLEAYRPGVGQSFGLSFLSGSERFRVAIGLALGIGQYASRQHRAIESVIIDEGFGCLDRDNRRTMIDELDHLRGQLRCILLVSHQEEFAEAFPEGYRFSFAEGTSRVERSE